VKLTIVGSASAAPNPGSASSCYLLETGEGQVLLECGHGAAGKMLLYTQLDQIDAVVISHMHPDHFFDLVPLKYLTQHLGGPPVRLFLPPTGPGVLEGLASGLGENGNFWSKAYDIQVYDPTQSLDLAGLRVTMTPTHHFIPAWSMRIEDTSSGRVLGYTSDTSLITRITEHLKGSDLLLAEASMARQTKPEGDQGHLTGSDAGRLACEAGAGALVLTHYPFDQAERILRSARDAFSGACDLAVEGQQYTI